jgi:hypothetical protein
LYVHIVFLLSEVFEITLTTCHVVASARGRDDEPGSRLRLPVHRRRHHRRRRPHDPQAVTTAEIEGEKGERKIDVNNRKP